MNWYKKAISGTVMNAPAIPVPSEGGVVPQQVDPSKAMAQLKATIQNNVIPSVASEIIPQVNNLYLMAQRSIANEAGVALPPQIVNQLSLAILSTWVQQQATTGNGSQAAGMVSSSSMVRDILNSLQA